jgi:hypothetical protein
VVVRCIALQRRVCLLSRPLSSLAGQALNWEEPFAYPLVIANMYCMAYVVMIVIQRTQVHLANFLTIVCPLRFRTKIISIIRQLHVVFLRIQTHTI